MKFLGIDSSGLVASVALVFDGILVAEFTTNFKKTHSQTLLPMIDQIIEMTGIPLDSIDAIATACGPGSFTGLRIGSSTAKGLGLALKKPIVPVPTLEGLAYNFYGSKEIICPIMDARRSQVYTGVYSFEKGKLITFMDQKAVSIEELLEELRRFPDNVVFLGDGVPVYREEIVKYRKEACSFAPAHLLMQRAGAVCQRAGELFSEGKTETAAEHKPVYLRLSQAERERKEKNGIS